MAETTELNGCHFVVEVSILHVRENPVHESGRVWRENKSVDVICESAQRAIEMLLARWPEADIHVVRKVGTGRTLLYDGPAT